MPFNGSTGVFTRLYNFVADAAAGIKILSPRMDAELNGIAAGLSNCVTRDGQSPPTADLPMGARKLVNLGAPTVATDAATKGYADSLVASYAPLAGATFSGAVKREANYGYDMVGSNPVFTVASDGSSWWYDRGNQFHNFQIGSATQASVDAGGYVNARVGMRAAGNVVWHAGNLNPSNYQLALGYTPANRAGDTFSGAIKRDAGYGFDIVGGNPVFSVDTLGASWWFDRTQGFHNFQTGSQVQGSVGADGYVNARVGMRAAGNLVWHAGNFTPSNYLLTTGTAANSAKLGGYGVAPTGSLNPANGPYVTIINTDGVTEIGSYLDWHLPGNSTDYDYRMSLASGVVSTSGGLAVGTSLTVGGNAVWHAGNFTPSNYQPALGYTPVNKAGDTLTGDLFRVANFGLVVLSGNPVVSFDTNFTFFAWDKNTSRYKWYIGNTAVMSLDGSGNLRILGNLYGGQSAV